MTPVDILKISMTQDLVVLKYAEKHSVLRKQVAALRAEGMLLVVGQTDGPKGQMKYRFNPRAKVGFGVAQQMVAQNRVGNALPVTANTDA